LRLIPRNTQPRPAETNWLEWFSKSLHPLSLSTLLYVLMRVAAHNGLNATAAEKHGNFVGCSRWDDGPWTNNGDASLLFTETTADVESRQFDSLILELRDLFPRLWVKVVGANSTFFEISTIGVKPLMMSICFGLGFGPASHFPLWQDPRAGKFYGVAFSIQAGF